MGSFMWSGITAFWMVPRLGIEKKESPQIPVNRIQSHLRTMLLPVSFIHVGPKSGRFADEEITTNLHGRNLSLTKPERECYCLIRGMICTSPTMRSSSGQTRIYFYDPRIEQALDKISVHLSNPRVNYTNGKCRRGKCSFWALVWNCVG